MSEHFKLDLPKPGTPGQPDPMQGFCDIWLALDQMRRRMDFMNFNVRGQFITIYMRIQVLPYYINMLDATGYTSFDLRDRKVKEGYPFTDYYCRIGPYEVRLACYHEKSEGKKP